MPAHLSDQAAINDWLNEAIRRGQVSAAFDGQFPRYVWTRPNGEDVWYEARLTNQELGQYKGYPLDAGQTPKGVT